MAKLYSDENYPGPVVLELRALGYDVLTAREAGNADQGIPDKDVLAFAISQGRAVLTLNRRHFVRLHRQVRPHAGIFVCSEDPDRPAQAQKIHQEILNRPSLDNQLIRINKS